MFTLSGGHVFPVYDAAVRAKLRIVDVRHEQTATFAAEGTAKLTRRPGLAVVTAGPGVTNSVSAVTSAYFTGVPLIVLGGRAPTVNWGRGGLQELDHVPLLAPVTKYAATASSGDAIGPVLLDAARAALTPHRGPVFVDVPMDVIFSPAAADIGPLEPPRGADPDPAAVEKVARLLAAAQRPAFVVGGDVYFGRAEAALARAAAALRVPVFANGMGRGCLPADDPLAFSRVRGLLRKEADLVVVIGTPLDFRLAFGDFGAAAVAHIADSPAGVAGHRALAASASPSGRATGSRTRRGSGGSGTPRPPPGPGTPASWPAAGTRSGRRRSTARCGSGSPGTRSSSGTAATSSRTRASTSTRTSRAAGLTPARTGAWGPGWDTRWRPGWRAGPPRWCCCSGTGRPASR
jgi:acetolactate synthase-1/2/3 large subunit